MNRFIYVSLCAFFFAAIGPLFHTILALMTILPSGYSFVTVSHIYLLTAVPCLITGMGYGLFSYSNKRPRFLLCIETILFSLLCYFCYALIILFIYNLLNAELIILAILISTACQLSTLILALITNVIRNKIIK